MELPIVIIAYNRTESLERLLNSLNNADYGNQKVDLIISIDKSDNGKVVRLADNFNWKYGVKKIIKHEMNLGLRQHVLSAGDLAFKYDGIIMLEDDLVVSKSFYKFAIQSVKYYKNDGQIGGISLYTYHISEFANYRTFIPIQDESDVFFMKVPSSWGQIWTNEQWKLFKNWYITNQKKTEYKDYEKKLIPEVARNWKDSSWKKYFYMYLAKHNKYIVYPRLGLSTNMADIGTHHKLKSTAHQSILMGNFDRNYLFKKINNSIAKYDAFFENEYLIKFLDFEADILIDYYGIKKYNGNFKYILTPKRLDYEIIKHWGLSLKPYELNILYNIEGKELFLYDLSKKKKNKIHNEINLIKYELPGITKQKALKVTIWGYKEAIKRRILNLFK